MLRMERGPPHGPYLPGPAGRLQALRDAGQPITPASLGLVDSGECMNTAGGFAFGAHGGVDSSDLDFKSPTWLEALESFDAESFEDARKLLSHSLRSAAGQPFCKLPRLLAMVTALKLAPSGEVFAQLKDPEGQMGAVLHPDVMEAAGGQMGPRAVLLLQQVVVVSPCPGLCYLCVTADNVMRVFPASAPKQPLLPPRTAAGTSPLRPDGPGPTATTSAAVTHGNPTLPCQPSTSATRLINEAPSRMHPPSQHPNHHQQHQSAARWLDRPGEDDYFGGEETLSEPNFWCGPGQGGSAATTGAPAAGDVSSSQGPLQGGGRTLGRVGHPYGVGTAAVAGIGGGFRAAAASAAADDANPTKPGFVTAPVPAPHPTQQQRQEHQQSAPAVGATSGGAPGGSRGAQQRVGVGLLGVYGATVSNDSNTLSVTTSGGAGAGGGARRRRMVGLDDLDMDVSLDLDFDLDLDLESNECSEFCIGLQRDVSLSNIEAQPQQQQQPRGKSLRTVQPPQANQRPQQPQHQQHSPAQHLSLGLQEQLQHKQQRIQLQQQQLPQQPNGRWCSPLPGSGGAVARPGGVPEVGPGGRGEGVGAKAADSSLLARRDERTALPLSQPTPCATATALPSAAGGCMAPPQECGRRLGSGAAAAGLQGDGPRVFSAVMEPDNRGEDEEENDHVASMFSVLGKRRSVPPQLQSARQPPLQIKQQQQQQQQHVSSTSAALQGQWPGGVCRPPLRSGTVTRAAVVAKAADGVRASVTPQAYVPAAGGDVKVLEAESGVQPPGGWEPLSFGAVDHRAPSAPPLSRPGVSALDLFYFTQSQSQRQQQQPQQPRTMVHRPAPPAPFFALKPPLRPPGQNDAVPGGARREATSSRDHANFLGREICMLDDDDDLVLDDD